MGPIFIILGLVDGPVGLADRLPRDYELLLANGGSDASRRHRRPLLGLILVILNNNIIFDGSSAYNMDKSCDYCLTDNQECYVDVVFQNKITMQCVSLCLNCARNGMTLREILDDDMDVGYNDE